MNSLKKIIALIINLIFILTLLLGNNLEILQYKIYTFENNIIGINVTYETILILIFLILSTIIYPLQNNGQKLGQKIVNLKYETKMNLKKIILFNESLFLGLFILIIQIININIADFHSNRIILFLIVLYLMFIIFKIDLEEIGNIKYSFNKDQKLQNSEEKVLIINSAADKNIQIKQLLSIVLDGTFMSIIIAGISLFLNQSLITVLDKYEFIFNPITYFLLIFFIIIIYFLTYPLLNKSRTLGQKIAQVERTKISYYNYIFISFFLIVNLFVSDILNNLINIKLFTVIVKSIILIFLIIKPYLQLQRVKNLKINIFIFYIISVILLMLTFGISNYQNKYIEVGTRIQKGLSLNNKFIKEAELEKSTKNITEVHITNLKKDINKYKGLEYFKDLKTIEVEALEKEEFEIIKNLYQKYDLKEVKLRINLPYNYSDLSSYYGSLKITEDQQNEFEKLYIKEYKKDYQNELEDFEDNEIEYEIVIEK